MPSLKSLNSSNSGGRVHVKVTGTNKGGGGQKFEVCGEHTF